MKGKISRETSDFLRCKPYFPIYLSGNISGGNHNSWKLIQTSVKNSSKFTKNHTCRWYDDTQSCNISCPNSTSFVRYKNNKFQIWKLSRWFVRNLLFLYLTNEVEFGQDILQGCLSSTCVIFLLNLDDFFYVICTDFHEFMVCTRYVP